MEIDEPAGEAINEDSERSSESQLMNSDDEEFIDRVVQVRSSTSSIRKNSKDQAKEDRRLMQDAQTLGYESDSFLESRTLIPAKAVRDSHGFIGRHPLNQEQDPELEVGEKATQDLSQRAGAEMDIGPPMADALMQGADQTKATGGRYNSFTFVFGTMSGIPVTFLETINPKLVCNRVGAYLPLKGKVDFVYAAAEWHPDDPDHGTYHIHLVFKMRDGVTKWQPQVNAVDFLFYNQTIATAPWAHMQIKKVTDEKGLLRYLLKDQYDGNCPAPTFGLQFNPNFPNGKEMDLFEYYGMLSAKKQSKMAQKLLEAIRDGKSIRQILEEYPTAMHQLGNLIKAHSILNSPAQKGWAKALKVPPININDHMVATNADKRSHLCLVTMLNNLLEAVQTGKQTALKGFDLVIFGKSGVHKTSLIRWLRDIMGWDIKLVDLLIDNFPGGQMALAVESAKDRPIICWEALEINPIKVNFSVAEKVFDLDSGTILPTKGGNWVVPAGLKIPRIALTNINPNEFWRGKPTDNGLRVDLLNENQRAANSSRFKYCTVQIDTPITFFPDPELGEITNRVPIDLQLLFD